MEIQTEVSTTQSDQVNSKNFLVADVASFVLHTEAAQAIFLGRWEKNAIGKSHMGLIQFGSLMTRIWKAYNEDDPYAHLYIIKTYDAIVTAQEKFKNYEITLQKQIENLRGFTFSLYRNPDPIIKSLRFGTIFGYLGAVLVENMDYVNRQLYTFNRRGLIPEIDLTTGQLMREVQTAFKTSKGWRPTGVTRKDIRENNTKAQEAYKKLGDIPPEVLNREIKLRFLREPRRHEKAQNS